MCSYNYREIIVRDADMIGPYLNILHSFYSISWLSLYHFENKDILETCLKNEKCLSDTEKVDIGIGSNSDLNGINCDKKTIADGDYYCKEDNIEKMNSIDVRFAICKMRLR